MMKKLIYIALALFIIGCQTVLTDVPVPNSPIKPVVFGNLHSLNNVSRIELTKSKPILNNSTSNEFDAIEDATLTVSTGTTKYAFTYDGSKRNYVYYGSIPFVSGEKYSLLATMPSFDEVTCDIEVPNDFGSYSLALDSIAREYEVEYAAKIKVLNTDAPQYYRIEAFNNYGNDTFKVYLDNSYFTDEGITTDSLSMNMTMYSSKDQQGGNPELYALISEISEEHYRYGKALRNYQPDNPFAEPAPLPNNVVGGLGIFTISNPKKIPIN
jgi:hypothetical protein